MKSFRAPRYLENYEDVIFNTEQILDINPYDTLHQKRDGIKFTVDNTGETNPFDWYNARLSVNFKVDKLADHAAIAVGDNIGTVNGSNYLTKRLILKANGTRFYECDHANQCINIKNLLEYDPSYAKSIGTNEYYFLDTSRHTDVNKYTTDRVAHTGQAGNQAKQMVDGDNPNYNKGFAARKVLLGASAEVNCEIPLNRYSFFEELQDKLLPNMRIDLDIEIDSDKNLIWRGGADDAAGTSYRLVIKRLQLLIPRLIFNSEGQKLYMENYLKPYKWTYLKEIVETMNPTNQKTGHFRLTNGIKKTKTCFCFFHQ